MKRLALPVLALVWSAASAQTSASGPVRVTPDNFIRAETDM